MLALQGTVYPRVGGGTDIGGVVHPFTDGLSPRGRGNHPCKIIGILYVGSIPAWAGEPSGVPSARRRFSVYPRVGGGTRGLGQAGIASDGLSPRGRGNPERTIQRFFPIGSIPAWAGEPGIHAIPISQQRVYPRVGGGTAVRAALICTGVGLSPRGRGNPQLLDLQARGLSPRGRGNRVDPQGRPTGGRVYPRVGGGTRHVLNPSTLARVYPRVGGGTVSPDQPLVPTLGLSPRGRGNLYSGIPREDAKRGSIPAWAGEPVMTMPGWTPTAVYPRVGGGTPRRFLNLHLRYTRSIPAWAGEPRWARRPNAATYGLSPRGRGNPIGGSERGDIRSIPAWAGEPPP